ncbi:MAG: ParB-like nuclease domain-containing protein [Phycisphaeraceae bacterium]|nr:ParB-like nuclease domain-containing protein [Phycisphaeraceae bacterium]
MVVEVALGLLRGHPLNSNVMSEGMFAKLVEHLRGAGEEYPPLIVRKIAGEEVTFEILDGHHRARALRELGRETASCVVWEVDDERAMVLLGTLNRLRGQDDPHKRAELMAQLRERVGAETLGRLLPESGARIEALLRLRDRPTIAREAMDLEKVPVAVHFFLLPGQRRRVEAVLKRLGGTREEGLMRMVGSIEQDAQCTQA